MRVAIALIVLASVVTPAQARRGVSAPPPPAPFARKAEATKPEDRKDEKRSTPWDGFYGGLAGGSSRGERP